VIQNQIRSGLQSSSDNVYKKMEVDTTSFLIPISRVLERSHQSSFVKNIGSLWW